MLSVTGRAVFVSLFMELEATAITVNYCSVNIILQVALICSTELCQHQYYRDMVMHVLYINCIVYKLFYKKNNDKCEYLFY